ncbi:MAG: membrane dipeptidase [Dehalococcoidia bacterium]
MRLLHDKGLLQDARRLHEEMIVVNGLDASSFNLRLVENMKEGGVDVNLVGLGSGRRELVEQHPELMVHGTTVTSIEEGVAAGKSVIVFGSQGPGRLEGDVGLVGDLHRLGLRSCGLSYNVANSVGSGCVEPDPGGLSHLGVELVERLNEWGICVDVAGHCSEATAFDAIEVGQGPVVCTHTNVKAIRDTPRGTTDEMFRAIADTGGVAGITAFRFFVTDGDQATIDDYVDHIEHVARLVGPEHVGLGFDFIYMRDSLRGAVRSPITFPPAAYPPEYEDWTYVDNLDNHSGAPLVTATLIARGWKSDDIAKVMGLNWLRVWKEVWGS